MKPMMIIPNGVMSDNAIKLLRDNGVCVVACKDPSQVKWLDPIPASSKRDQMEMAAIKMSRLLLSKTWGDYTTSGSLGQSDFTNMYVDLLVEGTELDRHGSPEEQIERQRLLGKKEEAYRLGVQEAREERERKKAEQKKKLAQEAKQADPKTS